MFQRSVSKIPSWESCASFSCSNLARCLCHSSGKRSLVEGFKSSSGRKRREDFSAAAAERGSSEEAPATLVTVTAAPVAAINSRLVIILFPFLLVETLLCGTLLTHFPSAWKRGMKRWQGGYLLRTEYGDAPSDGARSGISLFGGEKVGLTAAKIDVYEWAFAISNCVACGGSFAAGIYW